jgi:hypothetical protein
VYVTKDSAEVIELGWILLDAESCEEVGLDEDALAVQLQQLQLYFESVLVKLVNTPITALCSEFQL